MSRGLLDTSILSAFDEDAGLDAALPEEAAISVASPFLSMHP